jgi:hypothetical protein
VIDFQEPELDTYNYFAIFDRWTDGSFVKEANFFVADQVDAGLFLVGGLFLNQDFGFKNGFKNIGLGGCVALRGGFVKKGILAS